MLSTLQKCLALLSLALLTMLAGSAVAQETPSTAPAKPPLKKKSAAKTTKAKSFEYNEDFTVLPISKNSMKTDMAIVGEVDDKPGLPYIRERVHLEWRPGDPIDVYILKPRNLQNPPVILYLYSYPQDTDRFKTDHWGAYATDNGFAAVGFVSALTGHRLEHRAPVEDFFNQLPEALGASVHDVQMLLNYLGTRKDLDLGRVGMFGQGSGGSIALLASAVDDRIKAVDVLTPWGDWPTFIRESTFIPTEDKLKMNTPEFLKAVASLDPVQWIPKVKAQSLRIQNVRKDGHMPDAAQENIEAAAPEIAVINQYGDAAALVPAAMNGRLLGWLKEQLKPSTTERASVEKSQRIHFFPGKLPAAPAIAEPH